MRILGTSLREITPVVWSTILTALLIPCFRRGVSFGIALMILAVVTEAMQQSRKLSLRLNLATWLMLASFVALLFGLSFADNFDHALKEIEFKLSYFVFPLILFFGFKTNRREKLLIASAFVIGCLLRIPISIADAWTLYHETGSVKSFSYEALSEPYHPSYMALYQGVSIMLMLCFFFNEKLNKTWQTIIIVALSVSIIYISMLASRAGLIGAVMFIIFGSLIHWIKATNRLERIFLSGACFVVLIASSVLLPATSERIEALNITPTINATPAELAAPKTSSMELRLVTWGAAWNVLVSNPIGVGTGNTEDALVEQYKRMNETKAAEKKLNAHNQWLQMAAEFGWLGLGLIVALFSALAYSAWQQAKWVQLAILVVLTCNCLVESMLEVQSGIVFFGFLSILISPPINENRRTSSFS